MHTIVIKYKINLDIIFFLFILPSNPKKFLAFKKGINFLTKDTFARCTELSGRLQKLNVFVHTENAASKIISHVA